MTHAKRIIAMSVLLAAAGREAAAREAGGPAASAPSTSSPLKKGDGFSLGGRYGKWTGTSI